MKHFFSSLTPTEWTLFIGFLSPVLIYFVNFLKWVRKLEDAHRSFTNWALSFALPFLGIVASYLVRDVSFNHLVPVFATAYATSQAVYVVAVRWWKEAEPIVTSVEQVSQAPSVAPEQSF
jgi:endonuclease/exonuclease/phosphatase (EEP) superfamily protein YafD